MTTVRHQYDGTASGRRRILIGALCLMILVAVVGVWLAIDHTRASDPDVHPAPQKPTRTATSDAGTADKTDPPTSLKQITATADPRAFAKAVARALFNWDTAWPFHLSAYTGRLLAVADPTGQESPGLAADVAGYLPTPEAWDFLKPYYTRQWLEIATVAVPDLWPRALAEAGPNELAPGTTAYTIRGTRHRAGIWEDEPVTSEHEVAFTVFLVCEPTYPMCQLLRLSRLDEPLE